MFLRVFDPSFGTNQVLTATSGSQVANLSANDDQVRILNTGSNIAYVEVYSSQTTPAPTASVADFAIAPGQSSTITKGQVNDRIAYISALGTTLQVMTGNGF